MAENVIYETFAQKIASGYIYSVQASKDAYNFIQSLELGRWKSQKEAFYQKNLNDARRRMATLSKCLLKLGKIGAEIQSILFNEYSIPAQALMSQLLPPGKTLTEQLEKAFKGEIKETSLRNFAKGFDSNMSFAGIGKILSQLAEEGNKISHYSKFLDILYNTISTISKAQALKGNGKTQTLGRESAKKLQNLLDELKAIYTTAKNEGFPVSESIESIYNGKRPSNMIVGFANNVKGATLESIGPAILEDTIKNGLANKKINSSGVIITSKQTGITNRGNVGGQIKKGDFSLSISRTGKAIGEANISFSAKAFKSTDIGLQRALGSLTMNTILNELNSYQQNILLNVIGAGIGKGIAGVNSLELFQFLAQKYLMTFLGEDTHFMLYSDKLIPLDKFLTNHVNPFKNVVTIGNKTWTGDLNNWIGVKPSETLMQSRINKFKAAILSSQAKLFIAGKQQN